MIDVAYWHETDMSIRSPHVRCWGINGPGLDAARGLILTHLRNGPLAADNQFG